MINVETVSTYSIFIWIFVVNVWKLIFTQYNICFDQIYYWEELYINILLNNPLYYSKKLFKQHV